MSDSVRPHRQQPTRLPHPWDSPGKNTGVSCHFLLQCVKVKSLSHVWLFVTPWTEAHQAPPSMGFSRQEYWSGVPLPSPTSLSHVYFPSPSTRTLIKLTPHCPTEVTFWCHRHVDHRVTLTCRMGLSPNSFRLKVFPPFKIQGLLQHLSSSTLCPLQAHLDRLPKSCNVSTSGSRAHILFWNVCWFLIHLVP